MSRNVEVSGSRGCIKVVSVRVKGFVIWSAGSRSEIKLKTYAFILGILLRPRSESAWSQHRSLNMSSIIKMVNSRIARWIRGKKFTRGNKWLSRALTQSTHWHLRLHQTCAYSQSSLMLHMHRSLTLEQHHQTQRNTLIRLWTLFPATNWTSGEADELVLSKVSVDVGGLQLESLLILAFH